MSYPSAPVGSLKIYQAVPAKSCGKCDIPHNNCKKFCKHLAKLLNRLPCVYPSRVWKVVQL